MITSEFPGLKLEGTKGRTSTFEVFLNDKQLYSKLATGAYPKPAVLMQQLEEAMKA